MSDINERVPKVKFSKWVPWEQRTRLACANLPGLYLLLKNETVPKGPAYFKHEKVIYIGETGEKLRERWVKFARAALRGSGNHSGGRSYFEKFNGDMENLHVAAIGLELKHPYAGPIRLYLERKLILEYVFQHKRLPLCNKK